MKVTVTSPAKINISLSVGPRRADGFHDLATVFHAIDIRDTLTIEEAAPGSGPRLAVTGIDVADVPTDDTNLAMCAVRLLARQVRKDPDVTLTLNKEIPTAGGLAGGSTDAAAALVALNALWHTNLSREQLAVLAAQLGSDVVFCLSGATMMGTGRGEHVVELPHTGELNWVVAVAHDGLATPAVYSELDRLRAGKSVAAPSIPNSLSAALRDSNVTGIAREMHNDLEAAAVSLKPHLAQVLQQGRRAGAVGGLVSGSGPTCVFLSTDRQSALQIAAFLQESELVRRVVATTGPVAGAHVIARD